jgi:hypothetical protein
MEKLINNGWNSVHIFARGNTLMHHINGRVCRFSVKWSASVLR